MDHRGSVAVVGAGLSGAAAARRLAEAGLAVTILDKGRGVGGRMATRRVGEAGLSFDHGAQILRATGPAFAARIAEWRVRGVVAPWGEEGGFSGVPGMTAPARDLLAGLGARCGSTVTGLARDGAGWRVTVAEEAVEARFDAVALSVPAIQAARLLAASGLSLPGVEIPVHAPCWAVMLAFDGAIDLGGAEPRDEAGPIATVFREETKPSRPAGAARLVIHAGPAWSRAHLEEPPETIVATMIAALSRAAGPLPGPIHAAAHRWRHAIVETALGEPCLWDPAQRLGACGDGCLGADLEAAYDSGEALAARIVADLR